MQKIVWDDLQDGTMKIDWEKKVREIQDQYLCQYLDAFFELEAIIKRAHEDSIASNTKEILLDIIEPICEKGRE
ncbi:MAG: hypothetical protein V3S69_00215 [Dehalococcoidales bacterium]